MKKTLIILIILVLAGCGKSTKFSINSTDKIESYTSNAIFTKVASNNPPSQIAYKFVDTPESVFDIKTSDLKVLGGYVFVNASSKQLSVIFTIKGKADYEKLMDRVVKLDLIKAAERNDASVEKGQGAMWSTSNYSTIVIVNYNPFSDTSTLSIINKQ